jgi:hypothetical protein
MANKHKGNGFTKAAQGNGNAGVAKVAQRRQAEAESRVAKKTAAKARERAKMLLQEQQRLLETTSLHKEFNQLSKDFVSMLSGKKDKFFGLRLNKTFQDYSAFGIIKLIVKTCGRQELDSLVVVESTFDPIPLSENFLPITCLYHPQLKDVGQGATVLSWQSELHGALRHFLREEIAATRLNRHNSISRPITAPQFNLRKQKQVIPVVPAKKIIEEDTIDVTGHVPLAAAHFLSKDMSGIYHHCQESKLAYFRKERIAGVASFILIATDEGHPLQSCLEHHETVHVHLQDLPINDRPYGDLKEKRNARECVRQYLRQAGFALGVRPREKKEEMNVKLSA